MPSVAHRWLGCRRLSRGVLAYPSHHLRKIGASAGWAVATDRERPLLALAASRRNTGAMSIEEKKRRAGHAAAHLVESHMCVGLGTGSTARYAISELGRRLGVGDVRGVTGGWWIPP